MKRRLKPAALVLGGAALAALSAGAVIAFATPGSGFTSTVLARGYIGEKVVFGAPKVVVVKRKVRVKTKSGVVTRTVRIRVDSIERAITCKAANPCDTAFQQATVQPGGTSGWHTHPGATFVAVSQGEGTLYHFVGSGCVSEKISAGTGFSQMPTEVHVVRNEGSVPFMVYTLYVLPRGTPNSGIRVDQPQPAGCPGIQ